MSEIVVKDRVKETATAPGTGTITLGGAATGFQGFAAIGDTNTTYFAIVDSASGQWEVNSGVYNAGTLTRNATPLSSSNSGNLVNFTGTVDVFCTYPSEKAIYEEVNGDTIINGGPITILGTGVSTTPAITFDSSVGQMFSSVDNFSQFYNQNLSAGPLASADFVAYNDQTTTGDDFYVDMGMNSSTFDDATNYPIFPFNSAYLYSVGAFTGGTPGQNGDLYIGTGSDPSDVVFFAGGLEQANINAVIKSADGAWVLKDGATALSTNSGEKLQVYGTAKITGAVALSAAATTSASMSSPASNELVARSYVDSVTSTAFTVHTAVRAATVSSLNANYSNGTAGVGATLTADTNREWTTLDGVASGWAVGQRVLIKDQATAYQNGAYTITDLGSTGVSPWILTRATDFDTAGAGEIANNAYFYVSAGTVNAGSGWVLAQTAAITVGTTALPFDLFASAQVYTGGTNISVSGGVIALNGTVAATNGGTGYASYTAGQILYADTTTSLAPVNIGAQYQSLVSNGSIPTWGQVNLGQSAAITGSLLETNGGTGQSTYATGDTLYASATNTLSKLSGNTSTTKKFMVQTGTGSGSAAPTWDVVNGADVNGNISGSAGSVANALTAGTYLTGSSFDGSVARTWTVDATSANTVSKIVARDSSGNFSAGTITAALSGNATTATTATNVAGGAANKLVFNSSAGTTSFADAPSASGQVLGWNGSAFAWTTTIATATTATNLAGGAANQIAYQSGSGTTTFLANGTTGQVLTATTGSAPSWQTSTAASKAYAQAMRILGLG